MVLGQNDPGDIFYSLLKGIAKKQGDLEKKIAE
jgi:hypothetical protein